MLKYFLMFENLNLNILCHKLLIADNLYKSYAVFFFTWHTSVLVENSLWILLNLADFHVQRDVWLWLFKLLFNGQSHQKFSWTVCRDHVGNVVFVFIKKQLSVSVWLSSSSQSVLLVFLPLNQWWTLLFQLHSYAFPYVWCPHPTRIYWMLSWYCS
jgi:hypothetical protein